MARSIQFLVVAVAGVVLVVASLAISSPPAAAAGAAPVNVTNTPLPVREVEKPAYQPFQETIGLSIVGPSNSGENFIEIPVGKRLVIEYFSATGGFNDDQLPAIVALRTTVNSVEGTHGVLHVDTVSKLGLNYQIDPLVGNFSEGQAVRIYADAATQVKCAMAISLAPPANAANAAFCHISGYFIDVP